MDIFNRLSRKINYASSTLADYVDPESDYHFLSESELIRPQLCYE